MCNNILINIFVVTSLKSILISSNKTLILQGFIVFYTTLTNNLKEESFRLSLYFELKALSLYNYLDFLYPENEIINWQKDGSDNIEDYEHNHVLRTVLFDGEFSSSNSFSIGNKYEKTIDYNLADLEQYNVDYSTNDAFMGNGIAGGWNYNNLQIIAYIYDANTKEILQVKEKHLNH